jgi:hypothetical protein
VGERWTEAVLLGGATAALLGGREVDDGCSACRKRAVLLGDCAAGWERWTTVVLLVVTDRAALLGGTTVRCWVEKVDEGCAASCDGQGCAAGWYDGCAAGWKRWTKVVMLGGEGLRC